MAESITHDKVAMVLLPNAEWYKVDRGTFSSISEANFLSGQTRTNTFAWETHGASFGCPAVRSCCPIHQRIEHVSGVVSRRGIHRFFSSVRIGTRISSAGVSSDGQGHD